MVVVSGVVQGVGYRYFVQQAARKLGLNGFVRNRYSGDVEVEAEGDRGLLEELIQSLRLGPPASSVRGLKIDWHEARGGHDRFQITF
ncbi:acylphosphatase [Candidatus Zixiibacteriota bacterium]